MKTTERAVVGDARTKARHAVPLITRLLQLMRAGALPCSAERCTAPATVLRGSKTALCAAHAADRDVDRQVAMMTNARKKRG